MADFRLDELDAHEQPSDEMRAEWKAFSRMEPEALQQDPRVDDPRRPLEETDFCTASSIPRARIAEAFAQIQPELSAAAEADAPILFHPLLPGLLIIPSLLPPAVQLPLMDRMLHRDLSNPHHQTNLHLHYELPYPDVSEDARPSSSSSPPPPPSSPSARSFFSYSPDAAANFVPKDPSVHKPLSPRQVMQRRLHWVTLGGQYDWTNRVYPGEEPPAFPADIAAFLHALFPDTRAQAAIVNLYSPGDTMMMHRDVSEEINKPLVSLSFGCDCVFMISPSKSPSPDDNGNDNVADAKDAAAATKKPYVLLRLRSGDAIYMTGESRYAWHGVPKVIKDTCPTYLADWPATEDKFSEWKGWMQSKRINLNVRQMRE